MSSFLRRLPISRLLLLCGVLVAVGIGATALATALGVGPTPPPKPLPDAVHDALTSAPVEGVTAQIQLTNHLLEGASLAGGGGGEASQLTASPLLSGASGRLWISKVGHVRLELQSEKGDTQVYYDGRTLSMYDASSNTLYRYTPPPQEEQKTWTHTQEVPSVTKIEEGIAHLKKHADVSGATPTDVAGQAAYTVRVSPKEGGSLLGRRRALLGRHQRRAAASGGVLHRECRAGARTGRHLNLLRARPTVGVRIHAPHQRQGRRSGAA